jgi:hypothetical protein
MIGTNPAPGLAGTSGGIFQMIKPFLNQNVVGTLFGAYHFLRLRLPLRHEAALGVAAPGEAGAFSYSMLAETPLTWS